MSATIEIERLRKVYRIAGSLPSMLPWRAARGSFQSVTALEGINLEVPRGTLLGVIGENGSGKSTLLKILARVSPPTEGRVVVRGRVVSMLELGAAFQGDATGRENVFLNAALNGIPRQVVRRRMGDIVEFAGLEDFIDTPVNRYSSGMYLRLAFSVAVNMEPDVLLADEILAVGDIAFQERCLERIESDSRKGLTVLFVSHDMAAVRRLCERAIWLERGHILADGDAEEVTTAYETKALSGPGFLPEGASNEFATLEQTGLVTADGRPVGTIGVDEEAFIEAVVEVHKAPVDVRLTATLNAHGLVVLRARSPERLDWERPGRYQVRLRIPPHLLAPIAYDVKLGVSVRHHGKVLSVARRRAAVITVVDRDAEKEHEKGTTGFVRPELEWTAEPLTEAVAPHPGVA